MGMEPKTSLSLILRLLLPPYFWFAILFYSQYNFLYQFFTFLYYYNFSLNQNALPPFFLLRKINSWRITHNNPNDYARVTSNFYLEMQYRNLYFIERFTVIVKIRIVKKIYDIVSNYILHYTCNHCNYICIPMVLITNKQVTFVPLLLWTVAVASIACYLNARMYRDVYTYFIFASRCFLE